MKLFLSVYKTCFSLGSSFLLFWRNLIIHAVTLVAQRMVNVDLFSLFVGFLITLLIYIGLTTWFRYRSGWRIVSPNGPVGATLSETTGSDTVSSHAPAHLFSVGPKCFNGDSRTFKEWCFTVDLTLQSSHSRNGPSQVNLASSLLEGNALLWYISCIDSGKTFPDWNSLKMALGEAFGPLNQDEEDRLALFSLSQDGPLDLYIEEFTRLTLNVADLDQLSLALLFVHGLSEDLRCDAMREHPRNLSEAIRAARMAQRNTNVSPRVNRERRYPNVKADVKRRVSSDKGALKTYNTQPTIKERGEEAHMRSAVQGLPQ